jgi:hypothetical protein
MHDHQACARRHAAIDGKVGASTPSLLELEQRLISRCLRYNLRNGHSESRCHNRLPPCSTLRPATPSPDHVPRPTMSLGRHSLARCPPRLAPTPLAPQRRAPLRSKSCPRPLSTELSTERCRQGVARWISNVMESQPHLTPAPRHPRRCHLFTMSPLRDVTRGLCHPGTADPSTSTPRPRPLKPDDRHRNASQALAIAHEIRTNRPTLACSRDFDESDPESPRKEPSDRYIIQHHPTSSSSSLHQHPDHHFDEPHFDGPSIDALSDSRERGSRSARPGRRGSRYRCPRLLDSRAALEPSGSE